MGLLAGMDFLAIVISQMVRARPRSKKRVTSSVDVFLKSYAAEDYSNED